MLSSQTILMLAKPLIIDIVKDIVVSKVTPENLNEIKTVVTRQIMNIVGKTSFSFDDKLAEIIIGHMIEGSFIDEVTEVILSGVEAWVKDSATSWDDTIVLPAIEQYRLAIING